MKKYSSILILFVISLFLVCLAGCTQDSNKTGSKKVGDTITTASEDNSANQASSDAQANGGNASTDNSSTSANTDNTQSDKDPNHHSFTDDYEGIVLNDPERIPEEQRQAMDNITGKWQNSTPTDNGTSVVKAKFDNVGGFTLATGSDSSEYAHVGSYGIEGDKLTLSASTGGPSTGDDTYELRMDPAVFEYKYSINPELTQLTLTPENDNAKQLTGDGPITLSK